MTDIMIMQCRSAHMVYIRRHVAATYREHYQYPANANEGKQLAHSCYAVMTDAHVVWSLAEPPCLALEASVHAYHYTNAPLWGRGEITSTNTVISINIIARLHCDPTIGLICCNPRSLLLTKLWSFAVRAFIVQIPRFLQWNRILNNTHYR